MSMSPVARAKTLPIARKTTSGYWTIAGRKGLWRYHMGHGLAVFGLWEHDLREFINNYSQLITMARFYARASGHETMAYFSKAMSTRRGVEVEPTETGADHYRHPLTLAMLD